MIIYVFSLDSRIVKVNKRSLIITLKKPHLPWWNFDIFAKQSMARFCLQLKPADINAKMIAILTYKESSMTHKLLVHTYGIHYGIPVSIKHLTNLIAFETKTKIMLQKSKST